MINKSSKAAVREAKTDKDVYIKRSVPRTKRQNVEQLLQKENRQTSKKTGYPKLIGVLQLFFGALVGVSTPNQAEKNAYCREVFKWGHSMGSFVRVWKIIIRIDEPGLLKLRPGSLLNSNRFQLFKF